MPDTTQFAALTGRQVGNDGALPVNTVLVTRYKIMGVAGGGGMGTVYQARDLRFMEVRKIVAIKEMHNTSADAAVRRDTMATFHREANILATLSHPAIPKIFDFFDRDDRAYLVMEFINGSDIEALLAKTRTLPVEKVLEWAIDLCEVLNYLHTFPDQPVIFRDVKPSNIMIDSQGRVRLIDFGIAKTFVSGVKNTMIGTEGYSAPEQYKGDVSPRSDLYSLGATLHQILTRKDPRLEPPFSFHERPIHDYNPDVPEAFVNVIMRALSFNAEERYQNCEEMREALLRVRDGGTGVVRVPAPATPANGGSSTRMMAQTGVVGPESTGFFGTSAIAGSTIEPAWKFATEDEIRGTPTFIDDIALVGSYDTNIWALRLHDGQQLWKFPTHGGIAAAPDVDPITGLVLFGSEDYTFNAVQIATGRAVWSHMTRDRVRGGARVAHDHVFFGSDDGFLYALTASNGRLAWQHATTAPIRSRPYVTNDLIIFGNEDGEVVALQLSGTRKWSFRSRQNVTSSPVVDEREGICYVGSFDKFLYALDVSSGFSSWRYRTNGPVVASPVVHKEVVYFGSADGTMYAVNTMTARERWKRSFDKPIVASAAVHEGALYFGGTDGNFYCLDAETGQERWRFRTGAGITAAPCIAGNYILFGSMDHTLYALPLVR